MVEKNSSLGYEVTSDSNKANEPDEERWVVDLIFSKIDDPTVPRPGFSATVVNFEAILAGETPQEK